MKEFYLREIDKCQLTLDLLRLGMNEMLREMGEISTTNFPYLTELIAKYNDIINTNEYLLKHYKAELEKL